MRIGISISSAHEVDGPRLMIERARMAHVSGFASMSIGDHHNMSTRYAQNTPMLGRLLAEWPDRPAGCLFLVPLWHPLLMAEHIGTLASIHEDRFIAQAAIGWGADQFAAFGSTERTRGRVMEEAMPVVKRLLDGETVDSEFFNMVGGRVGLRPKGPVEWWLGAGADVALERAARLGDAWYGGPRLTPDDVERAAAMYRSHGGTQVIVRKDVLVLADGDHARQVAGSLVAAGYRGLQLSDLIVGDPDDAAEQLAPYHDIGVDEVVVRCLSVPQDLALETIGLLGPLEL